MYVYIHVYIIFPYIIHIDKAPRFERQWDDLEIATTSLKESLPG